jgi:hypothetical protein
MTVMVLLWIPVSGSDESEEWKAESHDSVGMGSLRAKDGLNREEERSTMGVGWT